MEDVTPSFVGRIGVDDVTRRVGMRDELPSSVLSNDKLEPWRDGGFEPGRDPGLEVLVGVYPLYFFGKFFLTRKGFLK